MDNKDFLFPYEKVRPVQIDMIKDVIHAIEKKEKVLVHAPTGIGKTISVLGPALKYALDNDKIVMMLTSRHTQHNLAVQTLRDIKSKNNIEFHAVDIIGKRWMCPVSGIERLNSSEFAEFCKSRKEDSLCEFYSNTYSKNELSAKAKKFIDKAEKSGIKTCEEIIEEAKKEKLCPYEISLEMSKKANVIVADYFYLFNPEIFKKFSAKTGRELKDIIVIIDEGHNLADRVRELLSVNLSSSTIKRALTEAKESRMYDILPLIERIGKSINEIFARDSSDEKLVSKKEFTERVSDGDDGVEYEYFGEDNIKSNKKKDSIDEAESYNQAKEKLEEAGLEVLKTKNRSYMLSIAIFLERWLGKDEGYTRIISSKIFRGEKIITLSYSCLDPSIITKEIIEQVHSLIIMSGTLVPVKFFKDTLGFDEYDPGFVYGSPFPNKNRLNLVVPKTTTKYLMRGQGQYQEIAKIASDISEEIKGNVIIFFPSYHFRDSIYPFFRPLCKKEILLETSGMKKSEKKELIEEFKNKKEEGAVLLAVTSGSFGEGIDLPGNLLNGVIVVGIPLQPPDLRTKELIKYYEERFGLGWDYGYILPAITKVLQNAGRCIRSEKDKGVIVFLDQRYAWSNYFRCFPEDWEVEVSEDYLDEIRFFFRNMNK